MICTYKREEITKKCSHGYDNHVKVIYHFLYYFKYEHNLFNYLGFMGNLYMKKETQFTGAEKYIWKKMMEKDIHWFPIN